LVNGSLPDGVWIEVPGTLSWVAFRDASAIANWDEFSGSKLTRRWPDWGFHFGLNGFQRQAAGVLEAMKARAAGQPWPTPNHGLTTAYPIRAHVRRLMRKFSLSAGHLAEQLAEDIRTESGLLAAIDQAQSQVISLVRDEKLSAFGRRAIRERQSDPTAVHEKLDPMLFLGPRTIDLDGWVREDTNLPFKETQGYKGPYFDLIRFRTDDVTRIWPAPRAGKATTKAIGVTFTKWLTEQMRASPTMPVAKVAVQQAAHAAGFSVSGRAFARAWANAVEASGAMRWSGPGPRSSRRIDSENGS
jgi:hypothetical protein